MLVGEMRGKRRALTPELQRTICEAIEAGNTRECAAGMAGVSERWLHEHMAKHAEFAAAIACADAVAEAHHVKVVQRAASRGTWQAAAWWLERRRPQVWGQRVRIDVEERIRTLATQYGLDGDEAVAEAERLLAEAKERNSRARTR
jgi:transposase